MYSYISVSAHIHTDIVGYNLIMATLRIGARKSHFDVVELGGEGGGGVEWNSLIASSTTCSISK